MRQRPRLFRREPALGKRPGLREQGEDGDARVAADDGDVDCGRVAPFRTRHKRPRSHHVEVRHPHQTSRVVHPRVLEHLRGDGHGGVDGVGYDVEDGVGARLGARGDEVANDARVDVEEIVAGHAGLARDPRGYDDEVAPLEGERELRRAVEPARVGARVDVRHVRRHPRRERNDVVQSEVGDEGASLEEEAQGLADAARGAEDGDGEPGLVRCGGIAADLGLEVRRELRHAPVRRAVVHLFVLGAPDYGSVWISETTPGRASAGRAGSWTAVGRGWNRRGGSRGCWEKNGRVKTRTLARARPK